MAKYLTKTLFITGLECPRKLYYTLHREVYENNKLGDSFLRALAQGGFQVGALAKIYHPEGIDLESLSIADAIAKTNELLKQDQVTIFEAAINYKDMLIKADILKKNGNIIYLYEVKAKSYTSENFLDSKGKYLDAKWAKYVNDVAFQTYVLHKYNSEFEIHSYLTLVNKNSVATVDSLNQKFKLLRLPNNRTRVEVVDNTTMDSVGEEILKNVDVSKIVEKILTNNLTLNYSNSFDMVGFTEKIKMFSEGVTQELKLSSRLDKGCKNCEFRCSSNPPLKSGFDECWGNYNSSTNFTFDIWDLRNDKLMQSGKLTFNQIDESDFNIEERISGLSRTARQWLQVDMTNKFMSDPYIDIAYLREEIDKWQYPLHFIDFETCRVAIPFNAGRRPYESIAFQFSHHIMNSDGTIEHVGEYINVSPGFFPNFEFVRELKKQLSQDNGTIFRYATHENTTLNEIAIQLENSVEHDKIDLINWIKTITYNKDTGWIGPRCMVDLLEIVKKCFYHISMQGSNSLKYVSPAVLLTSPYLQNKYKSAIYGADGGIKSLNFKNHKWVEIEQGNINDPYESLPPLFEGVSTDDLDLLYDGDEIKEGGAAMTAYAKSQFSEMSDFERNELRKALLQYCELDTFSMVLLCEYFINSCAINK